MASHLLSLEVPDTLNSCILRIVDTSVYQLSMPIKCIALEVTVPGFNRPVVFDETGILLPGFNLNLTACDLDIQHKECGTIFNDLPDGIYIIKQSVSPNEIVYAEYNHLRITRSLKRYWGIVCELELGICEPPETIVRKKEKLGWIKFYLEAAKAKVEFCHEPEKGMELFKYANKLLAKMDCRSCDRH